MSAAAGLVADIGGTNARLAWVAPGRPGLQDEAWVPVAEHATLLQAVQHYLGSLQQQQGPGYRPPRSACLAVATAVTGDEIAFTNSGWCFSQQALKQALGLESLVVLNDFEALALALPHLGASHLRLHGPALRRDAPLAVVGPGTGLGVACTLPVAGGWVALPGEGGHATLAPHDAFEDAVLAQARRHHAHVSAERLLSGIGLPLLHEAVAAADGRPIRAMSTPEIIREGLAGDTGCRRDYNYSDD